MHRILTILDHDGRFTNEQVAAMAGVSLEEAIEKIDAYEKEGVILGYKAIIDWEKTDRELLTALIEVKITPQMGMGFDKIAMQICKHPEVESVYLMSGGFDLTVIINGKTMKEVAQFVSEKLAPMESVLSTGTHFVLKKYKEKGVLFDNVYNDERRAISI